MDLRDAWPVMAIVAFFVVLLVDESLFTMELTEVNLPHDSTDLIHFELLCFNSALVPMDIFNICCAHVDYAHRPSMCPEDPPGSTESSFQTFFRT